ncbi:membrane protein [Sorangium cellulosum]|uniref:Membrane protein n=1 Tax=Sorangium cellulosum TaxID=56 RepID=A0A4P2Q595_SORCE|nr:membrane protein [Sorangium cellulosum]
MASMHRGQSAARRHAAFSSGNGRSICPERRAFAWRVAAVWLLALLATLALAPRRAGAEEAPAPGGPDIELFSRRGCPRCTAAKAFLDELGAERPGLEVAVRAVDADAAARARLRTLATRHAVRVLSVPAFYFPARDRLVIGFEDRETTGSKLRAILDGGEPAGVSDAEALACPAEETEPCEGAAGAPAPAADEVETGAFGRVSASRLGLPLFTVVLGLLDGFNPCAMWVLLFLLSMLVHLKSRRKMALIAATFVVVSGLAYFAFMAAWLNVFLLIGLSRGVQIALGVIAAVVGAINVKEFFAFKKGISLTIPERAKPGIYARVRSILRAEHMAGALGGVIVLAVLVNTVELLCTAGFPAVYTQILTMQGLPSWQHYAYLALYNVAYMADDAVMVTIAVVTLGHHKLTERGGRVLKLVSGVAMLGLAAALLFKPDLLV